MADRIGQKVEIRGGMQEFVGKTGTILREESPGYYRVKLDEPVEIDGIGLVADDLLEGGLLRRLRSRQRRPIEVEPPEEVQTEVQTPEEVQIAEEVQTEVVQTAPAKPAGRPYKGSFAEKCDIASFKGGTIDQIATAAERPLVRSGLTLSIGRPKGSIRWKVI